MFQINNRPAKEYFKRIEVPEQRLCMQEVRNK